MSLVIKALMMPLCLLAFAVGVVWQGMYEAFGNGRSYWTNGVRDGE